MKLYISLGIFNLKCLFYYALFVIFNIYIAFVLYYDEKIEVITDKNNLFLSFCCFLGYLLNIFPALISQRNSKTKQNLIIDESKGEKPQTIKYIYNKTFVKNLSTKDIIIFIIICFILLLKDFIEYFSFLIINKYKDEEEEEDDDDDDIYEEDFIFIEFIVIFLLSKFSKEVFYKHQNFSFLILILVEIIKSIFLLRDKYSFQLEDIFLIFLNIIYSILSAIYYIYMKELMKYKYISPYKSNFMIGAINLPIIIIIYIIISFTPLGRNPDDYYFCDSIFVLYKNIGNLNVINILLLITIPFAYGIILLLANKIIYNFTIYHIYFPLLLENLIAFIFNNFSITEKVFLISSFFIELIMILVFFEIIELNFCGLNENLKRNIEIRAYNESSFTIGNEYEEFDNEVNLIANENENNELIE